MKETSMRWGSFLGRLAMTAAVLGVVIFAAVRGAMARPGTPGGAARSFVTIAGTVTGVPAGTVPMQFTFRWQVAGDGGVREERCVREVNVSVDASGAFAAEVPLDVPAPACEEGFFDGTDVVVDVAVNGTQVVDGGAVNPVPYAIHATTAATATSAATANVANQYGTPDCPVGYTRTTDATFTGDMRLCRRRRADGSVFDEVVRVGAGSTAFWIDRYEAMAWSNSDGTGTQYGAERDDFPATFPDNGQWTVPLYSVSHAYSVARPDAARPTGSLTWFQANELCRIAGGRLPTQSEWLTAARGTPDPGASNGSGGLCNTLSSGPRSNGLDLLCRSAWGAQAMIGNLSEWGDEWYAGLGGTGILATPWPPGFNSDEVHNIASAALTPHGTPATTGSPAGASRGGSYPSGSGAGIFSIGLNTAPSYSTTIAGYRCVRTR